MPRYYCDYCDTYLTHDSPSVRKQHNAGYKHKANVRSYYQQFEEQQTQSLIDQRIKEHLGQAAAFQNQVGASFNQHLISLQGNPQRPRLPVMMPPVMPIGARPPVLPRPVGAPVGMAGYGAAPPSMAPPGAPSAIPGQMTMPPSMAPPASNGTNSIYQMNPSLTATGVFNAYGAAPGAPPAATAPQDSRSYGQASEQ